MLNRTRKGMTLLELIVVIVILGILAAIAIPTFESVITKSKEQVALTGAQAFDHDVMALAAFDNAAPNAGMALPADEGTYVTTAATDAGAPGVAVTSVAGTVTLTVSGCTVVYTPSGADGTSGTFGSPSC